LGVAAAAARSPPPPPSSRLHLYSSPNSFLEPARGTEVRLHDGVDQRHCGRGSGAGGRAQLLAPAVAGMVHPSMRDHTCAAAHRQHPFDEVSCSAPCRLVGSTASCVAQQVGLRARRARAAVRGADSVCARSYAEIHRSTSVPDLLERASVGPPKRAMVNRSEQGPPSRLEGWKALF
jgi:hypothetical protein